MTPNEQPKKQMSVGKKIFIGIGIVFLIGIIANLGKDKAGTSAKAEDGIKEETEDAIQKTTNVGQVLNTNYFDVTVNKVSVKTKVNTGNQFTDLKPEQGNVYLILNVTFKNTDNESRMINEGSVFIQYKEKNYEFDKSETIMLEGWGVLLAQLNPLTTKTTNIVYKIPAEIKGPAYYEPGRNSDGKRIFLGDI